MTNPTPTDNLPDDPAAHATATDPSWPDLDALVRALTARLALVRGLDGPPDRSPHGHA